MPSVYLCNAVQSERYRLTSWHPDIPAIARFACLMLDPAKGKAMIVSPTDDLVGTGIVNQLTGTTWADLRSVAKSTSPSGARRTTINTWLTNNQYSTITAGMTWFQVIHFVARQVNGGADLDQTRI